jgi:hypothetical protein
MNWFYSEGGAQKGPVDDAAFRALVANGTIRPDSLVWHEGMADWQPLSAAEPGLAPQVVPPPTPGAAAAPAAGAPLPPGTVPNHLVGAILSTILCCWPLGIPAIVYAAKVNGLLARGDLAGAQAASKSANTWIWIAFGIGLVLQLFNLANVLFLMPMVREAAEKAAAGGM